MQGEEKFKSRKRQLSAVCEQSYMQHKLFINGKLKAKLEAFFLPSFRGVVPLTSVTEMRKFWCVNCTILLGCKELGRCFLQYKKQ